MSNENLKPGAGEDQGFEHEDLQASATIYFLVTIAILTLISMFGVRIVYTFLDHREKADQPAVSPLVTNVPQDTLHVAPGYPQTAFPSPRLEEDERGQLNGIRLAQDDALYSYGWVDEQAGTVRIPIDRAMDLLVQRGLPVRPQEAAANQTSHMQVETNSSPNNEMASGQKSAKEGGKQ